MHSIKVATLVAIFATASGVSLAAVITRSTLVSCSALLHFGSCNNEGDQKCCSVEGQPGAYLICNSYGNWTESNCGGTQTCVQVDDTDISCN